MAERIKIMMTTELNNMELNNEELEHVNGGIIIEPNDPYGNYKYTSKYALARYCSDIADLYEAGKISYEEEQAMLNKAIDLHFAWRFDSERHTVTQFNIALICL